jgi:hypothetical protein
MLMQTDEPFGLKFNNIPLINLRMEFNRAFSFVFSGGIEEVLKPPLKHIKAPTMVWYGMPDDLFTLLLQRAILGIESYLPGALIQTSAVLGKLSSELFTQMTNPFSFGSRSTVNNLYHLMPTAVHEELSLRHLDQALYDKTVQFYKHIRNPIFHGKQLRHTNIKALRSAFDHLALIYEWIDYWFNPEKLIDGGSALSNVRARYASTRSDSS